MTSSFARVSRPLLALVLACALTPAGAETIDDKIEFDVVLKGIPAGRLAINGSRNETHYSAAGVLETTGLAAMLRKVRYTARVNGAITSRLVPAHYTETADTPSRNTVFNMTYANGTPVKVKRTPPRPPKVRDVAPATQGGTLDPLSALYLVLRDVDAGAACNFSTFMFDGARRTRVSIGPPEPDGEGVTCAGEYQRLDGFSKKDIAKKRRMAFTLTYRPTKDGRLQVTRVATDTIYGQGRLERR